MKLKLAISPCPNDTFLFHALLAQKIDPTPFEFEFELLDIEELNDRLRRRTDALLKVSFGAWAEHGLEEYSLLEVGSALGFGVGPVLLARPGAPSPPNRVLSPGAGTTAHRLWKRYYGTMPAELKPVLFSEIMPSLSAGSTDWGLCIHEGRFTYEEWGLELVADLGQAWHDETSLPLPLGGLVVKRALGEERARQLNTLLKRSLDYAEQHREEALLTMRKHAQEQSDAVLWKHVELYVNDFTRALGSRGRTAVEQFVGREKSPTIWPQSDQ